VHLKGDIRLTSKHFEAFNAQIKKDGPPVFCYGDQIINNSDIFEEAEEIWDENSCLTDAEKKSI
jgi:hypothetical protein